MLGALAAVGLLGLAACGSGGSGGSDGSDGGDGPDADATESADVDVTVGTTTPGDGATDDTTGSASPASGADPCALLDGIDLAAVLAEAPGEPEPASTTCVVRAADPTSHARLDLGYVTTDGAAEYAGMNDLLGVDGPVAGIGEEAISTGSRIHARSGDEFFFIQVVRNAATGPQIDVAGLTPVAQAIAGNAGW
ncbi:MAG TPA: hypothetical protein VIL36_09765 [Acidimicrobiales bacterium]